MHTCRKAVAGVVGEGVVVAVGGGGAAGGQATETSQWVEGWEPLVLTDGAGHPVEAGVLERKEGVKEEVDEWFLKVCRPYTHSLTPHHLDTPHYCEHTWTVKPT